MLDETEMDFDSVMPLDCESPLRAEVLHVSWM